MEFTGTCYWEAKGIEAGVRDLVEVDRDLSSALGLLTTVLAQFSGKLSPYR